MPNYKVVDADVLDADLQTVADAIKAKAGTEEALEFPSGFASAVESIETGGGGDTSLLGALLDDSLTEVSDDTITTICDSALRNRVSLVKASFPNVTVIKNYALQGCVNLETVNIPKVTTLMDNAFDIYSSYAKLKQLSLPLLTTAGKSALSVRSLESIYVPKLAATNTQTFAGCKVLVTVNLPSLVYLSQQLFINCSALTKVDTFARRVYSRCFNNCEDLTVLIFRHTETICTLNAMDALSGTPFAEGGTGGTVYCPVALIEQYQQATNWSTLYAAGTCNFVAIEGSEYE